MGIFRSAAEIPAVDGLHTGRCQAIQRQSVGVAGRCLLALNLQCAKAWQTKLLVSSSTT